MFEISKNVFIDASVAADLIGDPHFWLSERDKLPCRLIGGIHNLSVHDKTQWAKKESSGIRIIEEGTGREEVWFPPNSKGPKVITLDDSGILTSHLKYEALVQPCVIQDIRQNLPWTDFGIGSSPVEVWYLENRIHREPDRCRNPDGSDAAVIADRLNLIVRDPEVTYLRYIALAQVQEYWEEGIWKRTTATDITIVFTNENMNNPEGNKRAKEWLATHCHAGFFPTGEQLFGSEEEEFLFVAELCQG